MGGTSAKVKGKVVPVL